MFSNIVRTLNLLSIGDKRKGFVFLILMGFQAALEVGTVGLIMPFIAIVTDPGQIDRSHYLNMFYVLSGVRSPTSFLVLIGSSLIGLILFKNVFQTYLLIAQSRYSTRIQFDIERRLMSSYLMRDYLFHIERNPTELYQNMRSVSAIINLVISPLLQGISELSILVFMLGFLLWLHPFITLSSIILLGGMMAIIYLSVGNKARRFGEIAQKHATAMDQWMIQSFAGIKEVKILGREVFFVRKTLLHSSLYVRATFNGQILSQLSRPLIESVGFALIILFVLGNLVYGQNNDAILPTLVLFVAAAFRLMPALNRIVGFALVIRQSTSRVDSVVGELSVESVKVGKTAAKPAQEKYPMHTAIELKDIVYRYPSAVKPSLDKFSMTVRKGESIALVGQSGAGKTTVVDLLLGLLPDYQGRFLVDGIDLPPDKMLGWRQNFGYIPQAIYLSDDTVRRNVAFGLEDNEIDEEKVKKAIQAAQLEEVIARMPDGLDTFVGDRGARLSGGQRQRIGIARALYSDPEILILDEATSALDNETERAVSSAIDDLSGAKTIILIAHRLSTVIHCDRIFFMRDGQVTAQGTYAELLEASEQFRKFAGEASQQIPATDRDA
jgi:ABC-type bacteriocin/lantibiotic exporter with double-glycine peptidase domain